MPPTLTVSRAALALLGVTPTALDRPELTADVKAALNTLLEPHGFDLAQPIRVEELPNLQGFHLMQ
jgi:hypothetical protein